MRKPLIDSKVIKDRQKRLAERMKLNSAMVLFSHPELTRNSDVHHPYGADSDMVYLTGFEEPGCIFVFRPGMTPERVMFVRPKDELMETWNGFRFGTDLTKDLFEVDEAYDLADFEEQGAKLLQGVEHLYYQNRFDNKLGEVMEKVLAFDGGGRARFENTPLILHNPYFEIAELRLIKDDYCLEQMRKACEVSSRAHVEVMKAMRLGVNERALQGVFVKSIMEQGAAREAYGSIMATGNNATTLHYVFNDRECKDGDMFLIDAGAEFNYYAGDITRTYPVNGKFNDTQKRVYQAVLNVQKELVAMVKEGLTFTELSKKCDEGLAEIMIEESLLKESKDEIMEKRLYKKYYPHGVGHWLGMDVHDAGFYKKDSQARKFEAGMCFTIEPGIYIPANDESAPKELRGLGIRIEDDILVTASGHENLTTGAPKEISELEDIIGS